MDEQQTAIAIIALVAVIGFLAGISGSRYPKVPWLACSAIALAYFGFLVFLGTWASRCWDCGYETPRSVIALVLGIYALPLTLLVMTAVWLGTLTTVVWRSFRYWTRAE